MKTTAMSIGAALLYLGTPTYEQFYNPTVPVVLLALALLLIVGAPIAIWRVQHGGRR